ncbi:MAG: hypothetical protein HZC41_08445 [Chloroflexi bacterium]|nr:hypothetical protein [Chloroflexota bacterium]
MPIYSEITTLVEAEQFAASQGIRITATDRENIRKAQEAEMKRLVALSTSEMQSGVSRWVERFNVFYPRFLETLMGIGDVLMSFTQTLITSFGVPVILVLLLIVEQQRVVHGILLFEADPGLASFAATALVLLNLVLEVLIHHVEHQENYRPSSGHRFSLRLWLQNMAYTLGIGNNWQSQSVSPAQRYKKLLRLVTFSILALALAGSMRTVIANSDGAWYSAMVSIVLRSDLSLMFTWLGGLLFASAAVLAAQGLSRYVALRTVEGQVKMMARSGKQQDEYQNALDTVAAQYVLAKVAAAQVRQNGKDIPEVVTPAAPFSTNGVQLSLTE